MLETYRKEINEIDNEILALLEKRFKVTEAVGTYKLSQNIPVINLEREALIYDHLNDVLIDSPYKEEIIEVFKHIILKSRNQQEKLVKE